MSKPPLLGSKLNRNFVITSQSMTTIALLIIHRACNFKQHHNCFGTIVHSNSIHGKINHYGHIPWANSALLPVLLVTLSIFIPTNNSQNGHNQYEYDKAADNKAASNVDNNAILTWVGALDTHVHEPCHWCLNGKGTYIGIGKFVAAWYRLRGFTMFSPTTWSSW